MTFTREGLGLVVIEPEGDLEYEWLVLNTGAESWQWLGRSLVIEVRYAEAIIDGATKAGFVIEAS